jgi:hypothetical protein
MYEHIDEEAQKSGRYGKRAKDVGAPSVMNHQKAEGHRSGE